MQTNLVREQLIRRLPWFTILLAAVVATIGTFTGGIWAETGIVGGLVIFFAVWIIERRPPVPDREFALCAGITLIVLAISALLSRFPAVSWPTAARIASFLLPLLLLTSPAILRPIHAPRLFAIILPMLVVSTLALALELHLGGPVLRYYKGPQAILTEYDRGFSYLAVFSFPFLAWLWVSGRRGLIPVLLVPLFITASLGDSRAARLGLLLGLGTVICAGILPRFTRRGLMMVPFLLIAWPLAAQQLFLRKQASLTHLPRSWRDRLEIWDFLSYRIAEHPLLGWGLGTTRKLDFIHPHGALYLWRIHPAPHAHNVLMQLWVEMGVLGVALGIGFALLTLAKIGRLDRRLVPFALGGWVAALCLALLSYDFWTDSFFSCFALTGLMFALLNIAMPARDRG